MRAYCPVLALAVFSAGLSLAFAQPDADPRVPLRDGLYFSSPDMCLGFKKGEVDGAHYNVDNGGRGISGLETACVVASIRKVRPNRHLVETDCREFDEVFQETFFLDTPSREKFRIEGEEYTWCVGPPKRSVPKMPEASTPAAAALQKLSNRALIDYWADQEEGCRGGFGNDPATDRACAHRAGASDELKRRGLCFRKVKIGMDWVRCR